MLSLVRDIVEEIEADHLISSRKDALLVLSDRLGLDDFGEVIIDMPNANFPRLANLLPAMASDEVQDQWTGTHGTALLRQTAVFVRSMAYNYARITGSDIANRTILDYGCGYGRIIRMMWYFSPPAKVYGVDPWSRSIEECHLAGINENIALSDYMPTELPVGGAQFDLAYAFSVFTHLSKKAALAALAAVRRHTKTGGIFLITIRPVEYWPLGEQMYHLYESSAYVEQHEREGYAFYAHDRASPEATYGDASMTLKWIAENVDGWKVVALDRSLEDAYQVYVFLQAV